MTQFDPAETETAARRKLTFAATFDSLVTSNLELVKTVRYALFVITASAVLSMMWCAYTAYSMQGTLSEMRVMLQAVLDNMPRGK